MASRHLMQTALLETDAGRRFLRAVAVGQLLVLAMVFAIWDIPSLMVIQVLASSIGALALASLKQISRHRARLAVRISEILPVAQRAGDLVFDLLQPAARAFAAPARARPRPAASRLGRLLAVTLSPRFLPIPFSPRA